MATIEIDGEQVGYSVEGSSGDPVLLLHGTTMNRKAFDPVRAAMPEDARYRFVSMDLPGSGDSALPARPLTVEAMAAQANKLMHGLGHDRYHVAGHSLGAVVAAGIAGGSDASSVRSLTMIAGWMAGNARMRATFELWRRLIDADPELFVRYALVDGFTGATHEWMEPLVEGIVAMGAAEVAAGSAAQIDLDQVLDITELVAQVTAPTLLIGGSHDRWIEATHSHALGGVIKGSRVEVISAGHMMITEKPAEIAELLQAHLAAN